MLEDLNAKPQRKGVKEEAKAAGKRAYDRAYKKAAIDTAKAEGAAAGVADAVGGGIDAPVSAVESARQRALGGNQSNVSDTGVAPAPEESGTTSVPDGQRFVEVPARGRTYRVPDPQWYSASQEQRERLMDAVDKEDRKKSDDNLALRAAGEVMGIQDRDRAEIKALKGQLDSLLSIVEAMQRRLDAKDNQLEIAKSEALAQQQVEVAQTATNLMTIKLQADAEMQEFNRLREIAAAESRAQLEAQATAIDALKGSVKSTTTLMGERSNAVLTQLTAAESRQATLAVQQIENSDAIAANRATLRAVTGTDFASEIDLAVKRSFDDRLDGALEALIERRYVLLGPTTGTDGVDQKIDSIAKPFLAQQMGDNATERAVNRALNGGRS